MCGISGIYNREGVRHEQLHAMTDTLVHRGPDDEGHYINGPIGLGHRRLSIIDIDGGHQPLCNEDKTVWIVYNGEIYNYKSLRKELEVKGHTFNTATDTEVIIHLYEELGEKCVERLNGMFAFAIWDEKAHRFFLARDRIGQKPLYYVKNGKAFLFASEVKAILATEMVEREIDFQAIHHYLSLRFIPSPKTMFRQIRKLPAGHYLVYQNDKIRVCRYWDLSFQKKLNLQEREFIDALREKLEKTVKSHLISDVPVGAFLSGGMDTSTIVSIMGCILNASFKTFSIGVKEQDFNELPYARMVAEKYGTEHIEEVVKADLIRLLPKMIWHLDEPSDPIAACMFHAARLASRHVKVVLGGDGGDELFAGFDRYLGLSYIDYYNLIPSLIRRKIVGPIINSIPDSFTYKSLSQRLNWVHHLSEFEGGERYAEATSFFRFNHRDKEDLFNDGLWRELGHLNSSDIIAREFNKSNAEDPIDRMLYADFMTRLSEHTLMLTDRMNMAYSLEARSPFLDHSLVEFLATFPSDLKIHKGSLKYILRKVAENYLPVEILKRKKQGFMFPVAYWLRNELYTFAKKILLDSHFVKTGIFKEKKVMSLIEEHRDNRVDNHVRIWMLLNIEIWNQIYIEQNDLSSVEEKIMSYL